MHRITFEGDNEENQGARIPKLDAGLREAWHRVSITMQTKTSKSSHFVSSFRHQLARYCFIRRWDNLKVNG